MPLTKDIDLARILSEAQTIALVGASPNPQRPSYRVMTFLLDHGYTVFPVNPGMTGRSLQGQTVYARLEDIPAPVDMVDVFRNSLHLPAIAEEAIGIGARVLWTQLGVVDDCAAKVAEMAGLRVVMDRCPAIELPRFQNAGLLSLDKEMKLV